MRINVFRLFFGAAIFIALGALVPSSAGAAQAWSCLCDGERKRFLASTRFCESQNNLARPKQCSVAQWRTVYGPACKAKGCVLPRLRAASGS
jgi:hypothetical protein